MGSRLLRHIDYSLESHQQRKGSRNVSSCVDRLDEEKSEAYTRGHLGRSPPKAGPLPRVLPKHEPTHRGIQETQKGSEEFKSQFNESRPDYLIKLIGLFQQNI